MFLLVNMRKHACSKMSNSYLGPVSTICARVPRFFQSLLPILHHYPFLGVFGSPDQQSIVMCSHFHSGIGNGRSSPVGRRFDVKPLLDGMWDNELHTQRFLFSCLATCQCPSTQVSIYLRALWMYSIRRVMCFPHNLVLQLSNIWNTKALIETEGSVIMNPKSRFFPCLFQNQIWSLFSFLCGFNPIYKGRFHFSMWNVCHRTYDASLDLHPSEILQDMFLLRNQSSESSLSLPT